MESPQQRTLYFRGKFEYDKHMSTTSYLKTVPFYIMENIMVSLRISWGAIIMLHDLHHNSTLQPMPPYCTFFWFSYMTVIRCYMIFQNVAKFTTKNLYTDWVKTNYWSLFYNNSRVSRSRYVPLL